MDDHAFVTALFARVPVPFEQVIGLRGHLRSSLAWDRTLAAAAARFPDADPGERRLIASGTFCLIEIEANRGIN